MKSLGSGNTSNYSSWLLDIPINSWTKFGNFKWYCTFMFEIMWTVLITFLLLNKWSVMILWGLEGVHPCGPNVLSSFVVWWSLVACVHNLHIQADHQNVVGWWLELHYMQTPPTHYYLESSGWATYMETHPNSSKGHIMEWHWILCCLIPSSVV